jgi:hypothetical protein
MAGRWGANHRSYFVKVGELKIALSNTQHPGIFPKVRLRHDMRIGTKCKLGPLCGLDRGNLQWPGVVDLFSKS